MKKTSYYTFHVDGQRTGLIRRVRDEDRGTLTDQRIDQNGRWVTDPTLERHFREGYDLVKISSVEASEIAARYGGKL